MMAGTAVPDDNEIVYDRKYYADELRCFVPSCKKYRRDNPNLTFLRIPQPLKEVWCQAVERNCPKKPLYVCSEHINLLAHRPQTLFNLVPIVDSCDTPQEERGGAILTRHHTGIPHFLHLKTYIRLLKVALELKFLCSAYPFWEYRREFMYIDEDCIKTKSGRLRLKCTANLILSTICYKDTKIEDPEEAMAAVPSASTEVVIEYIPHKKCVAATQCEIDKRNKAILAKPVVRNASCTANIKEPPMTGNILAISHLEQLSPMPTSSSATPSLYEVSSPSHSITSSNKENVVEKDLSGRNNMLRLIKENPKKYIGVPEEYYWLVEFLAEECKVSELHIIITLFKIRYNDDISRICDQFNFSEVTIIESFKVCMPRLATFLQSFIYLPEAIIIKKTLPPVFKSRYANVTCIIDCFEIQTEKLSDTVAQAGTWSQYKSCNTAKYLVACCPNGFICFISKGYGGRISDKAITESCGFVDILPPSAVVLADRGFKGIETHLRERHIKLLRPPSVSSKETPTKKEVVLGKVIASLRIHIERLIRRIREFRFLKPHSVINHSHMRYLDESVIIACALVNLQDNLIKID